MDKTVDKTSELIRWSNDIKLVEGIHDNQDLPEETRKACVDELFADMDKIHERLGLKEKQ